VTWAWWRVIGGRALSRLADADADRRQDGEAGRERFVETAYWNPAVFTGADGKATVRVRAPGAMSEYRFTARGVTGADTLVGQAPPAGLVRPQGASSSTSKAPRGADPGG